MRQTFRSYERYAKLATGAGGVAPITQGGDFARYAGFAVPLSGSRTETQGVVLCYQLRTIDLEAHGGKRIEAVPEVVMDDVLTRIQVLIEQGQRRRSTAHHVRALSVGKVVERRNG